jgi:dTDP-4-dehydrorhamnose 3,5-epimerase
MKVQSPEKLRIPLSEAYEIATSQRRPIFVPTSHFADDRGWSLMNQLQGVMGKEGQVNFSVQYPGVVKAWHRHAVQTDFWMGLIGHLKVGVYDSDNEQAWSIVIGEKQPGTLIIPPPLWHGAATVGPTQAGLLYYVTQSYNPQAPDEERIAPDAFPGFPWEVEHK